MELYPDFMRNSKNKIKQSSQYTKDIEGFVLLLTETRWLSGLATRTEYQMDMPTNPTNTWFVSMANIK